MTPSQSRDRKKDEMTQPLGHDTTTTEPSPAELGAAGASGSLWDSLTPPAPAEEDSAREAYEDSAVSAAAEGLEDVPEWLGARWRDLPEESMPQVWTWLRGWVDWLVEAHRIPADEIPPCWYRHPEIVEELWAAANAEAQAWEATTATMMPMTAWHFHLRMMRDRLNGKAKSCAAKKTHVPERTWTPGWAPGALQVDEGDWAGHLAEVRDVQPVEVAAGKDAALWRMCAVGDAGAVVSSEGVEVSPASQLVPVSVSDPARRGTDMDGNVLLAAVVQAPAGAVTRTWWESSSDGGQSWGKVTTSEVDRAQDEQQHTIAAEGEQA